MVKNLSVIYSTMIGLSLRHWNDTNTLTLPTLQYISIRLNLHHSDFCQRQSSGRVPSLASSANAMPQCDGVKSSVPAIGAVEHRWPVFQLQPIYVVQQSLWLDPSWAVEKSNFAACDGCCSLLIAQNHLILFESVRCFSTFFHVFRTCPEEFVEAELLQ